MVQLFEALRYKPKGRGFDFWCGLFIHFMPLDALLP
jgi:hypothetical protein